MHHHSVNVTIDLKKKLCKISHLLAACALLLI